MTPEWWSAYTVAWLSGFFCALPIIAVLALAVIFAWRRKR